MGLLQDLRFAVRVLLRKPGFTAIVVLTLGLGIGAGSSMFSVIHRLLLRPVDFPDLDRLAFIQNNYNGGNFYNALAPRTFLDLAEPGATQSFEKIAAFQFWEVPLADKGIDPEQALAYQVSPGYFEMFGVKPLLGRLFASDEVDGKNERVAILSRALWDRRYGRDPAILGKSITVAGDSYTVVGVMPEAVRFPNGVELWAPLTLNAEQRVERRAQYISVVGKLKPGVSMEAADAELRGIGQRNAATYPEYKPHTVRVVSLVRGINDNQGRSIMLILFGAAIFLLLIACANVANLFLAHALARRKELAVRAALGAGRRRIVRQLLTEAALLGVSGGLLSLLFAAWSVELMKGAMPRSIVRFIAGWDEMGVNLTVLAFAIAVGVAVGLLFGVVPALRVSRTDLNVVLKDGDRGATTGRETHRLRAVLVVAQIALALILLLGGGAMVKGFMRMATPNLGIDPKNVLTLQVNLPQARDLRKQEEIIAFERGVMERLRAMPGLEGAAIVNNVPWGTNGQGRNVYPEGREVVHEEELGVDYRLATPGYLEMMRVPRIEGRAIEERDGPDAPKVALVSATAATRLWPGGSPIGKRFRLNQDAKSPWITVVGIVGDIRDRVEEPGPRPAVWLPFEQAANVRMYIAVRTVGDPLSMGRAVAQAVFAVDPTQPVTNIRTLDMVLSERIAGIRIAAAMMGAFALIALILAAVGIYGVVATLVTQRTHEIGVRMALGAQRADVLRLILRRGILLTAFGVVAGLGAGVFVVRLMASLLGGAIVNDVEVFAIFTTIVAAIAMLGTLVPAWRATRVDPLLALRRD